MCDCRKCTKSAAVSESYLNQGELQVVEAGAPVSNLHCQLSAGLAASQRDAGRHRSAPSLQHTGAVMLPTLVKSSRLSLSRRSSVALMAKRTAALCFHAHRPLKQAGPVQLALE